MRERMISDLQCSSRVLRRSLRMHCLALAVAVGANMNVKKIEYGRRCGERKEKGGKGKVDVIDRGRRGRKGGGKEKERGREMC